MPLSAAATEIEDATAAMRAEAAKIRPAGLYLCESTVMLSVAGQRVTRGGQARCGHQQQRRQHRHDHSLLGRM